MTSQGVVSRRIEAGRCGHGDPELGGVRMIWALLAAYLTKRPAWVQALVFGLCAGLFVTAAAESRNRDPAIGAVVLLVLGVGVGVGGAFYLGLRAGLRRGRPGTEPRRGCPS